MDDATSLSALAARIDAGDHQAEGELYGRLQPGVLTMLRFRTQNPTLAEDLTQETFRILLERMRAGPIDDPERLPAFVQGIARNLLRDDVKKAIRRGTDSDTEQVEAHIGSANTGFDTVAQTELKRAVHDLLDELSQPRDREILKMTFLNQQDKDRVCSELDISTEHFHRVIFRAKERFAKLVRERRPDLVTMEGAS